MFVIHGLILAFAGLSPFVYFKKAMTTLVFAFTSRTSAGTLPLTIRTLTDEMGVDNGVSNLAGSLSTSIGQNGCAAIYPAMLVVMVAPAVGQPITLGLPVGLAGLLVGIEPVIDMARTALNVSDGMVTALVSAKMTKNIDMDAYNDKSRNLDKKPAAKA